MSPALRPNASLPRAYVGKTVSAPKSPVLSKKVNRTAFHELAKRGARSRPTRSENHGKSGGLGFGRHDG